MHRTLIARLPWALALLAGSTQAQEEARSERLLELIYEGSQLCLKQEWQPALVFLNDALELAPEDVEALKWRGHALTGAQDYAAARVDLDQAVRLGADDAWTYYAQGMALYHLGEHEDAIAAYTTALRFDPTFFKAHEWRAFNRSQIGDHTGALLDIEAAIPHDPGNTGLLFIRARILAALLDFERAESDLWRVIDADGSNADAYAQLGYLNASLGSNETAVGMMQRALKLDPRGQVEVRPWLFHLLSAPGKTQEASAQLAAARAVGAEADATVDERWCASIAAFLAGEGTAEDLLAQANAQDDGAAVRRCAAWLHIGLVARRAGDEPAALTALARAVAQNQRDQWEWSRALRGLAEG